MVASYVVRWLRLEGLAVFAISIALYARTGAGWLLFIGLLLVPDISAVGYLSGPRLGATLYNSAHGYAAPLALAGFGTWTEQTLLVSLALVWTAHIGMDRMLGYGLKLPTGFRDTHLGSIGRDSITGRA